MDIQRRLPSALCALHNFIQTHDPDDETEVQEIGIDDETEVQEIGIDDEAEVHWQEIGVDEDRDVPGPNSVI